MLCYLNLKLGILGSRFELGFEGYEILVEVHHNALIGCT